MEENRIIDTLSEVEEGGDELIGAISEVEETEVIDDTQSEREQYEQLIKDRFKDFYAEDTQRLINRRFRKYKMMEERFKLLEEQVSKKEREIGEYAAKIADFDSFLRSEVEKAVKETEERLYSELKVKRQRPQENGTTPFKTLSAFDVSGLSKKDRADLAKRAASGERIKF